MGAIEQLPPAAIPGHRPSGLGSPEHPMRIVTRRAAGLAGEGWSEALRREVTGYFDELAREWQSRTTPERMAVVRDALDRGVGAAAGGRGLVVEVGSGTGTYSPLLAERFGAVLAVDISLAMLRQAPAAPGLRVRADGSRLPVGDASATAVVLVNAFLFPAEVDRVLARDGMLVWVNCSGAQTPIHLSTADVVDSLPGDWEGRSSQAGEGLWCVLHRVR